MGKYNQAMHRLLERKEMFADLMNGCLYGGRQILQAEELEMLSGQYGLVYEQAGDGEPEKRDEDAGEYRAGVLERRGDLRMRTRWGTYAVIFSGEIQTKVDYAMPVRSLLYDALEYVKQVQDLEKGHKEKEEKLKGGEFLSGITREDRLTPVVTMVLYTGDDWDGSRSLYGMMGIEKGSREEELLREYLPDYRLNLVEAYQIEKPEVFRTCLRQIFGALRYRKKKKELYQYLQENGEALDRMDGVEKRAMLVLLGEQKRLGNLLREKENSEGGGTEMCQAIDELIADGEKRGIRMGEKRGEERMGDLIKRLLEEGRNDLISAAILDEEQRKQLYLQYQIR